MNDTTKPADTHIHEDEGNFLHVVIYAVVFLVFGLIAAFLLVNAVGGHMLPGIHTPHPTSQLVLPGGNNTSIAAVGNTESPFIFPQQTVSDRV